MIKQQSITLFYKPYGIIYEIKNLINGKKYIGQTIYTLSIRSVWTLDSLTKNILEAQQLRRIKEK